MKPTTESDVEDSVETTQPTKNVVTGKDFVKLTKKALKLGATALDFCNRRNSKYFVTVKDGKKVHFGNPKYEDYLLHHDEERRKKYLERAKEIKNKQGKLTWDNPESALELEDSRLKSIKKDVTATSFYFRGKILLSSSFYKLCRFKRG